MTTNLLQRVAEVLGTVRLGWAPAETDVQVAAAQALRQAGLLAGREETLGRAGRIDIIVRGEAETVGVEVKRGRPEPAVWAQLQRYASSGTFSGLVLFCERAVSVPACAVPLLVIGYGRAHGVAL